MTQTKRILRLPQVQDKSGYKRTKILEMTKEGSFPAPISLGGRAVGWIESEVDQWIEDRIAASRGKVPASPERMAPEPLQAKPKR